MNGCEHGREGKEGVYWRHLLSSSPMLHQHLFIHKCPGIQPVTQWNGWMKWIVSHLETDVESECRDVDFTNIPWEYLWWSCLMFDPACPIFADMPPTIATESKVPRYANYLTWFPFSGNQIVEFLIGSVPKPCRVPTPTTVILPLASGYSSGNRRGHVTKAITNRFEISRHIAR